MSDSSEKEEESDDEEDVADDAEESPDAGSGVAPSLHPDLLASLPGAGHSPGPSASFEKVSCLGEGGFGAVWLAKRRGRDEYVALKEIARARVASETESGRIWEEKALLRLVAEERARAQGAHPSPALVGLVETYTTGEAVCIVLDLVEGAPLHVHIKSAGALQPSNAAWYSAEVAGALDWMHNQGWMYRDLKLSNVMVCARTGRTKLVDFGFATNKLRATSIVGTLFVMAPEVITCCTSMWGDDDEAQQLVRAAVGARGETLEGYGPAADWWSLGVVLFEMLVGKPPFGMHDDILFEGRNVLAKHGKMELSGLPWPGAPPSDASQDGEDSDGSATPTRSLPVVEPPAREATSALLHLREEQRLGARSGASELQELAFWRDLDWAGSLSPAGAALPGPPFDAALGDTVESARAAPRRPRRAGAHLSAYACAPDAFRGF